MSSAAPIRAPTEILPRALAAKQTLTGLFRFRAAAALDMEQLLIFLALGSMNLEASDDSVVTIQPINIATLCLAIELPRETVRRKLLQLEAQKWVRRSAAGFFIEDLGRWNDLAAQLVPRA